MDAEDREREALLPTSDEAEGLLAHLAGLVRDRGAGPLVSGVIVEPTPAHFPDAWAPTLDGVERLARRLLGYAGLAEVAVQLENEEPLAEAAPGECSFGAGELPVWFAGMAEGRCVIEVNEERLEDAEVVAAALCHVVAHVYRLRHGLAIGGVVEGSYREQPARRDGRAALEERLTDVTAIYLGLGVIAANGALRQRTTGHMVGSYATWQMSTARLGTLGPHAASYLLAAQVVARGLGAAARQRIGAHLETNQAAYFEAACADLEAASVAALRERLGVPDPSAWPAPPDLEALTAPYAGHRPTPVPRERRREAEGEPVFRVRNDSSVSVASVCGVAAWLAAAYGTDGNLLVVAVALAFAVPLGLRLGRRIGPFDCASCEARLTPGVDECPGCGGHVVGEIAGRGDRLAALEAYEKAQKHGGADPRERWTKRPRGLP